MTLHVKRMNSWRDQFNPMRGLTIARAVQMIEAGERGEYADLQWAYRSLEKRDSIQMGLLANYEAGLNKLDWQIKVTPEEERPPGATDDMAEAQRKSLREVYDRIDNLREAITFLVGAKFRGFAHLEKHVTSDGAIVHLEPIPQWYWCREGINGPWTYNPNANSGTRRGVSVVEFADRLVIREVDRPVNELALFNYVFKNMARKDWAGFIETYGIPPIFIEGPPGATPAQEADYLDTAGKIISNARGYLPNGAKVQTVDAGQKGANPFKDFLDDLRAEVVLAGTGGKLTMLTESGSGTLAGGAHSDIWDSIIQGEAMIVSEILNKEIDAAHIEAKFPGQPVLAYMELCAYEETDVTETVANIASLSAAGYHSLPGQVEEKTGLKLATIGGGKEDAISMPDFRLQAEAYGIAVRAGAITPNLKDEEHFRKLSGLPPIGPEVRAAWSDDPTRGPITLQQEGAGAPPQFGRGTAPSQSASPPIKNRDTSSATPQQLAAQAAAEDLAPVRARLSAILAINDPQIQIARLTAFLEELPQLRRDMGADPALSRVLEQITARSFATTLAEYNTTA